jgi:hypothetical protein
MRTYIQKKGVEGRDRRIVNYDGIAMTVRDLSPNSTPEADVAAYCV